MRNPLYQTTRNANLPGFRFLFTDDHWRRRHHPIEFLPSDGSTLHHVVDIQGSTSGTRSIQSRFAQNRTKRHDTCHHAVDRVGRTSCRTDTRRLPAVVLASTPSSPTSSRLGPTMPSGTATIVEVTLKDSFQRFPVETGMLERVFLDRFSLNDDTFVTLLPAFGEFPRLLNCLATNLRRSGSAAGFMFNRDRTT